MPYFEAGQRVIDAAGGYAIVIGRDVESSCDCNECRHYLVSDELTGLTHTRHHEDLEFAPPEPLQPMRPRPTRGSTYRVDSGPAEGMLLTVQSLYNNPRMTSGTLYDQSGVCLRTAYDVPDNQLGDLARLPASVLPPELRMPTDRDLRWANADPSSNRCNCVTCQDHTCGNQCRNWGCRFYSADDCQLLVPRAYNYREALTFHGSGPLFLGAELELQTRSHARSREAIEIVNKHIADKVMIKGDGSIEEEGIELAFHPMDYDHYVNEFPTGMLTELKALGVRSHVSCGMHVHASRAGFSSTKHSFLWQKFFYRNEMPIVALSRRLRDRLDRWATFGSHGGQGSNRGHAKHFAKGAIGGDRYSAINACNAETLEVRIFASTLSPQQFLGALGLVDASVEYTRNLNFEKVIKEKAWGFDAFKSYVSGIDKYKPLKREIARLGL
jgi:hypothetical protein